MSRYLWLTVGMHTHIDMNPNDVYISARMYILRVSSISSMKFSWFDSIRSTNELPRVPVTRSSVIHKTFVEDIWLEVLLVSHTLCTVIEVSDIYSSLSVWNTFLVVFYWDQFPHVFKWISSFGTNVKRFYLILKNARSNTVKMTFKVREKEKMNLESLKSFCSRRNV